MPASGEPPHAWTLPHSAPPRFRFPLHGPVIFDGIGARMILNMFAVMFDRLILVEPVCSHAASLHCCNRLASLARRMLGVS